MDQQIITQDSTERWIEAQYIRDDGSIESFPGYMISDHGRVGSWVYPTNKGACKRKTMKIIKHGAGSRLGHQQYQLHDNGKRYNRSLHRLMMSSFHPEQYFEDAEVDHINRDPTDNRLCNLRWVTKNQNATNRSVVKQIKVTHLDNRQEDYFESGAECSRAFGKGIHWCANIICKYNGFHEGLNILIEKI